MTLSVGPLAASSGEKVSGNVPLNSAYPGENNSTTTAIPITIVNGMEEGPTLVVLSGIHGSEYIPILTTQRLANDLHPRVSIKRGAVIFVHIANLPAYFGRTVYTSPVDGKNLNRVFPGQSNGTLTEQIANFLVQAVYPHADLVMDIHSGDANEQLYPSYTAYYGKAGSHQVIQASRAAAMAFGTNLVVEFQWELSSEASTSDPENAIWSGAAAVVRGIPSMDVEMAPGMGQTDADSIDQAYRGILRVMMHLGILSQEYALQHKGILKQDDDDDDEAPCLVKDRQFIEAPMEGSWIPLIDSGTFVLRGTRIGYITDLFGKNRFPVSAPEDGLLLIRFETPPVREGDTVAVVAALNNADPACDSFWKQSASGEIMHHHHESSDDQCNHLVLFQIMAATGWAALFFAALLVKRINRRRQQTDKATFHSCVTTKSTDDDEMELVDCAHAPSSRIV